MFKFNFSNNENRQDDKQESKLSWFPAAPVSVPEEAPEVQKNHLSLQVTENLSLKVINVENLVENLSSQFENLIKAESEHSDLLPGVYEGGLKIWECSFDLIKYLDSQNINFEELKVLDLGCGAGIVGIFALLKGSHVYFQDYNNEVLQLVTIPNVFLNTPSPEDVRKRAKFYSGDWESLVDLLFDENDGKFDLILTSETIYNSSNQGKLHEIFARCLKPTGAGFVAGKSFYFGVGGNMKQFEELVRRNGRLEPETVWKNDQGLQREILKLSLKFL